MRHGIALWLICLSLVGARVVGLHLHACAGLESGEHHAGTHYADNGFLFGDHHSQDDGDDRDVDWVAALVSQIHLDLGDLVALVPPRHALVSNVQRLLTLVAPRGPPLLAASHLPHFAPPLRGPPSISVG